MYMSRHGPVRMRRAMRVVASKTPGLDTNHGPFTAVVHTATGAALKADRMGWLLWHVLIPTPRLLAEFVFALDPCSAPCTKENTTHVPNCSIPVFTIAARLAQVLTCSGILQK